MSNKFRVNLPALRLSDWRGKDRKNNNTYSYKKNSIFAANIVSMIKDGIIDGIREVAQKVLPKGSVLYLYGSRARGDHRDDSDWDLLLLLDKQERETDDFDKYAYPIIECGFDFWQYFSVQTYTKDEWYKGPHAMFFYNVEQDKKLIYES